MSRMAHNEKNASDMSLDEEDRHQCGRCKAVFVSIDTYFTHKKNKSCRRTNATADDQTLSEVGQSVLGEGCQDTADSDPKRGEVESSDQSHKRHVVAPLDAPPRKKPRVEQRLSTERNYEAEPRLLLEPRLRVACEETVEQTADLDCVGAVIGTTDGGNLDKSGSSTRHSSKLGQPKSLPEPRSEQGETSRPRVRGRPSGRGRRKSTLRCVPGAASPQRLPTSNGSRVCEPEAPDGLAKAGRIGREGGMAATNGASSAVGTSSARQGTGDIPAEGAGDKNADANVSELFDRGECNSRPPPDGVAPARRGERQVRHPAGATPLVQGYGGDATHGVRENPDGPPVGVRASLRPRRSAPKKMWADFYQESELCGGEVSNSEREDEEGDDEEEQQTEEMGDEEGRSVRSSNLGDQRERKAETRSSRRRRGRPKKSATASTSTSRRKTVATASSSSSASRRKTVADESTGASPPFRRRGRPRKAAATGGVSPIAGHQCPECPFFCDVTVDFDRHLRVEHNMSGYICGQCHVPFRDKYKLKRHLESKKCVKTDTASAKPPRYMKFPSSSRIYKHETTEADGQAKRDLPGNGSHLIADSSIDERSGRNTKDVPMESAEFRCRKCDCKFETYRDICAHIRTHRGLFPGVCRFCGRWFRTKFSLWRHVTSSIHDNVGEDALDAIRKDLDEARICWEGGGSVNPDGYRRLQCSHCGSHFSSRQLYQRHLKKCGGATSASSSAQSPAARRRFACSDCGTTFYHRSVMEKHLSTCGREEGGLTCGVCRRTYTQPSHLLRHRERLHVPVPQAPADVMAQVARRESFPLSTSSAPAFASASAPASSSAPTSASSVRQDVVTSQAMLSMLSAELTSSGDTRRVDYKATNAQNGIRCEENSQTNGGVTIGGTAGCTGDGDADKRLARVAHGEDAVDGDAHHVKAEETELPAKKGEADNIRFSCFVCQKACYTESDYWLHLELHRVWQPDLDRGGPSPANLFCTPDEEAMVRSGRPLDQPGVQGRQSPSESPQDPTATAPHEATPNGLISSASPLGSRIQDRIHPNLDLISLDPEQQKRAMLSGQMMELQQPPSTGSATDPGLSTDQVPLAGGAPVSQKEQISISLVFSFLCETTSDETSHTAGLFLSETCGDEAKGNTQETDGSKRDNNASSSSRAICSSSSLAAGSVTHVHSSLSNLAVTEGNTIARQVTVDDHVGVQGETVGAGESVVMMALGESADPSVNMAEAVTSEENVATIHEDTGASDKTVAPSATGTVPAPGETKTETLLRTNENIVRVAKETTQDEVSSAESWYEEISGEDDPTTEAATGKDAPGKKPKPACPYCTRTFPSLEASYRHKISGHKLKLAFRCVKESCRRTFERAPEYEAHAGEHPQLAVICAVCNEHTGDMHSMATHKALLHRRAGQVSNRCTVCKKTFASEQGYLEHVSTAPGHHDCVDCGRVFRCAAMLTDHRLVHSDSRRFLCDTCGNSFKTRLALSRHLLTHNPAQVHACEVCGAEFNKREHLNRHLTTHSDSKPFACDVCSKRFKRVDKLRDHKKVHSDAKPYNCHICGRRYRNRDGLSYHLRSHEREQKFVCDVCGVPFTRPGQRKKHMEQVHEVRFKRNHLYPCGECPATFKQPDRVRRHHEVDHQLPVEWRHRCPVCLMGFTRARALKNHVAKHHCKVASPPSSSAAAAAGQGNAAAASVGEFLNGWLGMPETGGGEGGEKGGSSGGVVGGVVVEACGVPGAPALELQEYPGPGGAGSTDHVAHAAHHHVVGSNVSGFHVVDVEVCGGVGGGGGVGGSSGAVAMEVAPSPAVDGAAMMAAGSSDPMGNQQRFKGGVSDNRVVSVMAAAKRPLASPTGVEWMTSTVTHTQHPVAARYVTAGRETHHLGLTSVESHELVTMTPADKTDLVSMATSDVVDVAGLMSTGVMLSDGVGGATLVPQEQWIHHTPRVDSPGLQAAPSPQVTQISRPTLLALLSRSGEGLGYQLQASSSQQPQPQPQSLVSPGAPLTHIPHSYSQGEILQLVTVDGHDLSAAQASHPGGALFMVETAPHRPLEGDAEHGVLTKLDMSNAGTFDTNGAHEIAEPPAYTTAAGKGAPPLYSHPAHNPQLYGVTTANTLTLQDAIQLSAPSGPLTNLLPPYLNLDSQ